MGRRESGKKKEDGTERERERRVTQHLPHFSLGHFTLTHSLPDPSSCGHTIPTGACSQATQVIY